MWFQLSMDVLRPRSGEVADLGDEVTQDGASLDRRELVGVADQYEARPWGHGAQQFFHQAQVDHRGLVDHDELCDQRVVGTMLERVRRGGVAEQAMKRARLRQPFAQAGVNCVGVGQAAELGVDGLLHARCGPAGRCGEGDVLRFDEP